MLAMPATANRLPETRTVGLDPKRIKPNQFSISIYGDPSSEIEDLLPSIREHGILVAMVVAPGPKPGTWELLSGHRRLACAMALDLAEVPCEVRRIPPGAVRRRRRPRRALGIGGQPAPAGEPAERAGGIDGLSRCHRMSEFRRSGRACGS
jgi:hypothetical protein